MTHEEAVSQRVGRRSLAALAALVALLVPALASADLVEDFYKGRTVTLIIASGEGGGYDITSRLAAQHLGKHIPGHPTIIAKNMPGASGIGAVEYMYNAAPKDGTFIAMPQPPMVLTKVLDRGARFEPEKFTWVGRFSGLQTFGIVSRAAPAQTVAAARTSAVIMGAAQGAGTGSNVISALNQLVGTKFTLVKGYKSVSESGLALERGEIQGIASVSWEFLESKGWTDGKTVGFLYVVGLTRNRQIPDTPTIVELSGTPEDRDVLKSIASASEIGRAILAPPDIPAERAAALRNGFDALMRDPDFLHDAARRKVEIEPLAGDGLQKLIADAMAVSPDVAERTRRAIR